MSAPSSPSSDAGRRDRLQGPTSPTARIPVGCPTARSARRCPRWRGRHLDPRPARRVRRHVPGAVSDVLVHQAAGMVMVQTDTSIEEALVRLRATAFAEGRPLGEAGLRRRERSQAVVEGGVMNDARLWSSPRPEYSPRGMAATWQTRWSTTSTSWISWTTWCARAGAAGRRRGRPHAGRPARRPAADGVLERDHPVARALACRQRG